MDDERGIPRPVNYGSTRFPVSDRSVSERSAISPAPTDPLGVIPSAPFEPDALRRPGFEPVRGRAALLALALLQGTFPGSDDIPADQLARRFAHIREACEELLGVLELPRHP